jgi:two-component system, NtrC family, nitrogen regulation response regulator NtrX
VRELKNVVERAAILSDDNITIADLPEDPHTSPFEDDAEPQATSSARGHEPLTSGQGRATLREHREATERTYIVDTLKELDWNISKAAVLLGVERTNLHKKIRAYGIKRGGA